MSFIGDFVGLSDGIKVAKGVGDVDGESVDSRFGVGMGGGDVGGDVGVGGVVSPVDGVAGSELADGGVS